MPAALARTGAAAAWPPWPSAGTTPARVAAIVPAAIRTHGEVTRSSWIGPAPASLPARGRRGSPFRRSLLDADVAALDPLGPALADEALQVCKRLGGREAPQCR